MRFIDNKSLETLKINSILEKIETLSSYGMEVYKKTGYFSINDIKLLQKEFDIMEFMKNYKKNNKDIFQKLEGLIHRLKNLNQIIKNCRENLILDEIELFELKIQVFLIEEIRLILEKFPNEAFEFKLNSLKKMMKILDPNNEKIGTFYIYDSYSLKLKEIRDTKKNIEKEIYSSANHEKTALLKEKRLEIVVEEEKEELRIREIISKEIFFNIDSFEINIQRIGKLDFLITKISFAEKYGGVKPEISKEFTIDAKGLINIELHELLVKKGKKFTPVSIVLEKGVTVITGANMGGKTIALRTIAENLYLFHRGFFPLGERVSFPIVDYIFYISDDMQDLSKGLSTFGAEISKLKEVGIFLELGKGFIAFDEFARGTNPEEGKKFAKSLANFLNSKESISLMTTHFDGIVNSNMNHYQVVGLKNIDFEKLKRNMELNKNSLGIFQEHMDYRLEKTTDFRVPKYAYNIATLLGVEKNFLEILKKEYEIEGE